MSNQARRDEQKKEDSAPAITTAMGTEMLIKHKTSLLVKFNATVSKPDSNLDNIQAT